MKLKINYLEREEYFNCKCSIFDNTLKYDVLLKLKNYKQYLIKQALLIMINKKCIENTDLLGKYSHPVNRKN